MAGMAVTRQCGEPAAPSNGTMGEDPAIYDTCALSTASTLALCVGLIHLLMAVLRLEIITTYFSDQLVSGFTTAASCHVFATQLKDLFGIRGLRAPHGPGNLFKRLFQIITHLDQANPVTCLIGFGAIVFLIIGKDFVNPYLKKRFHLPTPLPLELMVVIFSTAISAIFSLNSNFNVKIVQKIPTGFVFLTLLYPSPNDPIKPFQ